MNVAGVFLAILISMLPVFELRAGIPIAVTAGLGIIPAFLLCTLANILIIPVILLFLEYVNHFFLHVAWYRRLFDRLIVKKRKLINRHVKPEFEFVGLLFLVAIPFPGTGAYTGALIAWLLGLHKKSYVKTLLAIGTGVVVAGLFVAFAVSGIMTIPDLFS